MCQNNYELCFWNHYLQLQNVLIDCRKTTNLTYWHLKNSFNADSSIENYLQLLYIYTFNAAKNLFMWVKPKKVWNLFQDLQYILCDFSKNNLFNGVTGEKVFDKDRSLGNY